MRCKEHYQGDRCLKEAHHESQVNVKPDPTHLGQFNAWQGDGDSKRLIGVSQLVEPRLKRNRQLNRFLRYAESSVRAGITSQPKEVLASLDRAINFLRGSKTA